MSQNSNIEWTDDTFNPWWGCTKVSEACKHCYAESTAKRYGHKVWGDESARRFFDDKHWRQPVTWNAKAKAGGVRRRVFCASMADVFEKHAGLPKWRKRLWPLIEETPWLDWQLLTKRPHRIGNCAPWKDDNWPSNVWLGTTVENQRRADERISYLVSNPAAIRFLSCEPLLAPIDLTPWLKNIEWVIVGGESGPKARPMHPEWATSIRDQCIDAGIPFFFKQWGEWSPIPPAGDRNVQTRTVENKLTGSTSIMYHVGKKAAGRLLDGRTWSEFPERKQSKSRFEEYGLFAQSAAG